MKKILITIIFSAQALLAQSVNITYNYDSIDRMTAVSYSTGQDIAYTYDEAGNIIEVTHNGAAPIITLIGANPFYLNVGSTFVDPSATAQDDIDGDVTASIQTSDNVNTSVAGTYTVTYTVTDSSGNTASALRSVVVSGGAVVVKNDFNGDGVSDIFWRHTTEDKTYIWYMNEDGSHTAMYTGRFSVDYEAKGIGDFNGDGRADIFWRHTSSDKTYIWYMNADGSHTATYTGRFSVDYEPKGIVDFNADGRADIFWRHTSSDKTYIWYMNADGSHTATYTGRFSLDYEAKGIDDFNGDGRADIFWRHTSSDKTYIWYMNADGSHTAAYTGRFSVDYEPKGTGDFNGDGVSDIFWRHTTEDKTYIWYMNVDGSYTATYTGRFSLDYEVVVTNVVDVVDVVNFTIDAIANADVVENATYNGPIANLSGDTPIGDVIYSLGGVDGPDFSIDTETGVVSMTAPGFDSTDDADGDYVYEVSITATDDDDNSASEAWTVTVTHRDGYRVINYNGQEWLDRNLGATAKCTDIRPSLTSSCMGDYYQWGRAKDGHQRTSSTVTNVLSPNSTPTHGDFIITANNTAANPSLNWIDHSEPDLWQSTNNINAVCPTGWHVPTKTEFEDLEASDASDAFSKINLHTSSYRNDDDGIIDYSSTFGFYWTSTVADNNESTSFRMSKNDEWDSIKFSDYGRANGFQIRCIKD